MWYLTAESDNRYIYVLPKKEVTIGRSVDAEVCNFAITDDASISRKHATLSISDSNSLILQDVGSRYGTTVNGSKVDPNSIVKLNINDVITLGKMGCVWKVHTSDLITCTSTLKGENLQNLNVVLSKLGGLVKSEWDDSCAYLTMPAITLTIKVCLALAQGSQIVTVDYWSKCLEAMKANKPLPSPNNFTPQIIESTLNKENVSFLPNGNRKTLFAGKTIIFFSKRQLDMYKAVLLKCAATPLLMSDTKMSIGSLSEPTIIVIQYNNFGNQETQTQRDQINEIINYLQNKGKRLVPDAEIGLAILYCSTHKYCNPGFNFTSEVIKQTPGHAKLTNILAQESQEPSVSSIRENVIINESLSSSYAGSLPVANSKRKTMEDADENPSNATKKLATGNITLINETGKRKHNDEHSDLNPSKKMAVDDDDDMFNFMSKTTNNDKKDTDKKLNLSKPQKRKADNTDNDDDLFNFVRDKRNSGADTAKNKIFDINNGNTIKDEPEDDLKLPQKPKDIKVDISALRGSKLKELEELNSNISTNLADKIIKKENDTDEIEKKMCNLDFGTTIVRIRSDLIKKEPTEIVVDSRAMSQNGANFKKFKKVWPLKMNAVIIPKSTSRIIVPEAAEEMISQSY